MPFDLTGLFEALQALFAPLFDMLQQILGPLCGNNTP
jgi:hypothetical protein